MNCTSLSKSGLTTGWSRRATRAEFSGAWLSVVLVHAGCLANPARGSTLTVGPLLGEFMTVIELVTDAELRSHNCLERVDKVPGDPETSAFKRRARLHQALWREDKGLPIGSQPMRPKPGRPSRPLGSRIAVDVARESQANFLSEDIRRAVTNRLANPQPHQMLNEDRLYCDLLSSMPMCFNLFGTLPADLNMADRAIHAWWPDVPGRVCAVLFEWSPGRRLPGQYLENRSAFDVAFELQLEDGSRGILGVETKYHEDCKREKPPDEDRRTRYAEVSSRSGVMSAGSMAAVIATDLQQIWLDHLLALSILQHPSAAWSWAGFALVHPGKNPSYALATERYRSLLEDAASFRVSTVETLLSAHVLPEATASAFSERYLW